MIPLAGIAQPFNVFNPVLSGAADLSHVLSSLPGAGDYFLGIQ
jgi:hypothetical protein